MNPKTIARSLVEAHSPSGDEGLAMQVASRLLRELGLRVEQQEVGSSGRFNVLAAAGRPRVVLTTHLDTVPGELPIEVREGRLHGRGACDAKGSAAAMIAAAADLLADGQTDFGLLFVVGEETTSDGAIAANQLIESGALDWPVADTLLAEPTNGKFVTAHPGVAVATLRAEGRCAHSAYPEHGRSAIHALLDTLDVMRSRRWPTDSELGETRVNVGRIGGGSAANVLAGSASAQLMIRSGAPISEILEGLRECIGSTCALEVECESEPVRFAAPATELEAENAGPVPFATDAPFFAGLGRRYLCGPGSIHLAHTAEESISLASIDSARALYFAWARERLLTRESRTGAGEPRAARLSW